MMRFPLAAVLAGFLLIAVVHGPARGESGGASGFYNQALARIAEGDSSGALALLDRALDLDSGHGPSLVLRGKLKLARGLLAEARKDFSRAVVSEIPEIRVQAHIGLGDMYRKLPLRNLQAISEYRLALRADPASREALYALAQAGFGLNDSMGYRMAAGVLARLVCLDPGFRDVYALWCGKVRDRKEEDRRRVNRCIEAFLAADTEHSAWWMDLALDRFGLDEVDGALDALEKLEQADPRHKTSDRFLLKARCLLDLGDTLGFENCYESALKEAEKDGDFTTLCQQAEPIFTPEEYKKWEAVENSDDAASFFRAFWKRRDPDPLSGHNERLINHYLRLSEAEKWYSQLFPHSRFQNSKTYFRLLSPWTMTFEYDPVAVFWDRSRSLDLDQRGLLFIRHGAPDRVEHPEMTPDPIDIWLYGSVAFPFVRRFGAGDFLCTPVTPGQAAAVKKAMETESFTDPLPVFSQDYYLAYFRRDDGRLEVEFYQSAPVSMAPQSLGPEATVAIYDSTWDELARDAAPSHRVVIGPDTLWMAVNQALADPGDYFCAVRLDLPGYRAVHRGGFELEPFAESQLDLGGIILGSPAVPGQHVHQRKGVEILPRPSLTFAPGEIIAVYLEVYNLKKDREGRRAFNERIIVGLVENEKEKERSIAERVLSFEKDRSKSLILNFDRQVSATGESVPEYFDIDTAYLKPGSYRLIIELTDKTTGLARRTGFLFELARRKK